MESTREKAAEELIAILDSRFFKTLSEPVRIDLLKFLIVNGRSDIAKIAENFSQDRSVISRHLQMMHEAGILLCEKRSRHVFYEIAANAFLERIEHIANAVRQCIYKCCPPKM